LLTSLISPEGSLTCVYSPSCETIVADEPADLTDDAHCPTISSTLWICNQTGIFDIIILFPETSGAFSEVIILSHTFTVL